MKRNVIILIGPDGVGKTTVVRMLLETLGQRRAQPLYLGMKDYALRITERFSQSEGRRYGLFVYLLFPLDLFLKSRGAKRGKTLLVDRLPAFPFRRKGSFLSRLYSAAIGRIDLLVLLDAPVEVLMQRKQEDTAEKLHKVREKNRRLFENIPAGNKLEICTENLSPEAVVQRILQHDPSS